MPELADGVLADIVKAYDIRGVVGEQLTPGLVKQFGAAFARFTRSAVVVGHDMRISSPELAQAFGDGVLGQGFDVINIGLAGTEMVYFASGWLNLPGAMFTASHNPAQYNGIKLCRAGAAAVGQDTGLMEIRRLVEQGVATPAGVVPGKNRAQDVLADYADYVRSMVDLSHIRPLTVVVDAANGMAGYVVPRVFANFPIKLVPMYFELDGSFPHHPADPLNPANLVDLQAKVREIGADLGLAFDGDADRCFVVDERGNAVSPSAVTALIAVRELAKEPGASVIHNVITSKAVPEIIEEHGGKPIRSRVGHSLVKEVMGETGAIFGGEHSAHYFFRDFWRADSGLLAALHVLAALGSQQAPLSELMRDYTRYVSSGEINSTVDDQQSCMANVKEFFRDRAASFDKLDGLTVELPDGSWFNLRPSNTEPLLRLNVEAHDDVTLTALRDEVLAIVRG